MNGVQLTGIIQPDPSMIYDEVYAKGELVIPKQAGQYTLFSIQPVYTQEDEEEPVFLTPGGAGFPAQRRVQVTWLAADDEAYKITAVKFLAVRKEQERQAALAQAQPKILVPQR